MRFSMCYWLTACCVLGQMTAATLHAQAPPADSVASVKTIYTLKDGRMVVIEESGPAVKAVKAAACGTCGAACDCGPGCVCDAMRAGNVAAAMAIQAPRRYYLPSVVIHPQAQQMPARMVPAPSPFTIPTTLAPVVVGPNLSSTGFYLPGSTYTLAPVAAQAGVTRRGVSFTGPFGGGFRAGSECAPGG